MGCKQSTEVSSKHLIFHNQNEQNEQNEPEIKDKSNREEITQLVGQAMEEYINANKEHNKLVEELSCELDREREGKEELKEKVLTQANEITELRNETGIISRELAELRISTEHKGCYLQQELKMTITNLKRIVETGVGSILKEIEIARYELDCFAKTENTHLLVYLRSWDGSYDDQLVWPFSAECQIRIFPAQKGVSQLTHKQVILQLDRVLYNESTFLEMSRDKLGSKSSKLIGRFPLSIVMGDRYNMGDSLKLELTLKCYAFV